MTWQFTLAGLLIGILVGLTGMGGGSLMTPILIILFGFDAKVAVGTDILHGAIFKSFGAVRCRQLGIVHARLALWMFLGSGPMSLAGVAVASALGDSAQAAENYAVGGALVLGGIGLIARTLLRGGMQPSDAPFLLQRRDKIVATSIGAVFGFVVGLTSVGSGTFFGLVMVLVYPLTVSKIVGTDIFHAAALLWSRASATCSGATSTSTQWRGSWSAPSPAFSLRASSPCAFRTTCCGSASPACSR